MQQALKITLLFTGYRLGIGLFIVSPVLLSSVPHLPYRSELLACLYLLILLTLLGKAYFLGGGMDKHVSQQINQIYAIRLNKSGNRYIDLHCLSLFKIAGIWLAFPAAWITKVVAKEQLLALYETQIDHWLDQQAPCQEQNFTRG